jgi:hypothetical protein
MNIFIQRAETIPYATEIFLVPTELCMVDPEIMTQGNDSQTRTRQRGPGLLQWKSPILAIVSLSYIILRML